MLTFTFTATFTATFFARRDIFVTNSPGTSRGLFALPACESLGRGSNSSSGGSNLKCAVQREIIHLAWLGVCDFAIKLNISIYRICSASSNAL